MAKSVSIADVIQKIKDAETIIEGATVFVNSVPSLIRDAIFKAQQEESDQPLFDVADELEAKASVLSTNIVTNSKGDPAPVGNVPASTGTDEPVAEGTSTSAGPVPSTTDPNAPQAGVQASDPSNPTIEQSKAGSDTADAAAEASGAKSEGEDAPKE